MSPRLDASKRYQLIRAGGNRWHLRGEAVGMTLCGIKPRQPAYRATQDAHQIDCRECLLAGIQKAFSRSE